MTDIVITPELAEEQSYGILADLFTSLQTVSGSLLASADGRVLAADLDEARQRPTAAIVASSFALGQRLAEAGGGTTADELIVEHEKGTVAIYAVGRQAALVILGVQGCNLGMIRLRGKAAAQELAPLVPLLLGSKV